MATQETGAQLGRVTVKVIGVGGGGCNAVARMFQEPIEGVDYLAVNTDAQHLQRLQVSGKVRIGDKLTRGLGVGGNPEMGRTAAEESREELYEMIQGADMVFLAAGMGGGTGTGASPVVAEIAKETGALTIAVVTKPFSFEGHKRRKQAEDGIQKLQEKVDSLIIIPNDRLLELSELSGAEVTADAAFRMADDVLRQGIQSIAELVSVAGTINLDFSDVKAIMGGAGPAWMAIGTGRGENRAVEAARAAISSPLLDTSIDGAKGVLINVTGGSDLTLQEVHAAAQVIEQVVDPNANIIFGMVNDLKMKDEVKVTIIATGFTGLEALIPRDDSLFSRLEMSSVNDADALDIPPFLRRSPAIRRKGGFLRAAPSFRGETSSGDSAGVVRRVISGDTIELESGERVTIAALNAPDLDSPIGARAKALLEEVLKPGTEVYLSEVLSRGFKSNVRRVLARGKPVPKLLSGLLKTSRG